MHTSTAARLPGCSAPARSARSAPAASCTDSPPPYSCSRSRSLGRVAEVSATVTDTDLEQRAINVIRGLCMDGPQAANAGHPGTGMALAPLAYVLWTRIMKYDASDIHWPDRDRFILSAGHASILLYSMLYLSGNTDLTLADLKQFRQWGSKTAGHPEVHHT